MTHAYDEVLFSRAADSLGRMLDYSVYSLHYDIPSMMELFIASGNAALFERGDIRLIAGMSGIELSYDVLERSGLTYDRQQPRYAKGLSAEYWCGYTLAQIQWTTCLPFSTIIHDFSASDFISDYGKQRLPFLDSLPLSISEEQRMMYIKEFGCKYSSDASVKFFASVLPAADPEGRPACSLKDQRLLCGLSQSALAKASGIPVRTIQQYEQGQKDLNKARAEYLLALSQVLHCEPSQLISKRR